MIGVLAFVLLMNSFDWLWNIHSSSFIVLILTQNNVTMLFLYESCRMDSEDALHTTGRMIRFEYGFRGCSPHYWQDDTI
jgi:hypothetical protein